MKPPAWGSGWVLHQPGKSLLNRELERTQKILVKTPMCPVSLFPTKWNSELKFQRELISALSVMIGSQESKEDPSTTPQHLLRIPYFLCHEALKRSQQALLQSGAFYPGKESAIRDAPWAGRVGVVHSFFQPQKSKTIANSSSQSCRGELHEVRCPGFPSNYMNVDTYTTS